ncbi:MAG: O-antigen ligase family protein [Actinomycetota bacterium]
MTSRTARPRTARRDAAFLVPAAAGSAGFGVLAGEAPLLAGGAAAVTTLSLLTWLGLFVLLSLASVLQSHFLDPVAGFTVGGLTVRPEQVIILPFLVRAYLLTRSQLRNRWGVPEWILLGFVLLQPVTTILNSPDLSGSLPAAGLLAFGALAYYAVFASVCSRSRLVLATRVFLGMVLLNAVYGLIAEASHLVMNTSFGVSTQSEFGAGVYGLSFEHDVFASTCAAGAIVFYALWRERTAVISTRLAALAFWLCAIGMLLGLARGAWIGFGIAFLLMFLLPSRRARGSGGMERVGVVLLLVTVIGLVGGYVFTLTQGRDPQVTGIAAKIGELVNTTSGTGRARLSELRTALSDLPDSPLIGLGTSTYDQRHPLKHRTNYIGNMWLRALYDSGIIGLLLLAVFLAAVIWPTAGLLRARGETAAVARALTFGWIVLAVAYAATDDTLFMWPWIFLGLVRAGRMLAAWEDRRQRREPRATTAAGVGEPPPDEPLPAALGRPGA